MVRNLFKHEAKAYLHTLVPMNIVLLCIALFARIVWLFENDATIFYIVGVSSIFALVVAMIVSLVMSVAFAIVRFYKNLFTCEGYLTMTLPVTPAQHILTKLTCAVGFEVLTVIAIALAASVAMAGDVFVEVMKVLAYIYGSAFEFAGADLIFWTVEIIILLIVVAFSQFLLYYTCITIGQLARKNRVLAAFGAYFVYYFICQILGTVMIIIFTLIVNTPLMIQIGIFIEQNPKTVLHVALIGYTVLAAAVSALYYFITHRIMSRKLNLE